MKSIVVLLSLFCLCQGNDRNVANAPGCPKNWIRHADRCYYISPKDDTFDGANKYCQDKKSQLATGITCDAHMTLIEVLAFYRAKCPRGQICEDFWIGIKDITATNWRTGNNFTIEMTRGCQQWAEGYPRGDGKCGIMSLRGTLMRGAWKSKNCTDRFKYVCITCPNNYEYMPEVNECFYLNLMKATWSEAQKNCANAKRGARLMTIFDSTKEEALKRYMQLQLTRKESEICLLSIWPQAGRIMFMGGQTTIPDVCGTPYVWKQLGAADIPFTYSNWLPNMPNCNNRENCIVLVTAPEYNFRWDDVSCSETLCSLCEF